MGHNENRAKRKVHNIKCLHKEIRNFLYQQFKRTPEKKAANTMKRSRRQGKIKIKTEINQLKTEKTRANTNTPQTISQNRNIKSTTYFIL